MHNPVPTSQDGKSRELTPDELLYIIASKRGFNSDKLTSSMKDYMSAVAYHESKNDSTAIQLSGNKATGFYNSFGTGKYQYERNSFKSKNTVTGKIVEQTRKGDHGGVTGAKSARNFLKKLAYSPAWLDEFIEKGDGNFSVLNEKQQDIIFIAEKANSAGKNSTSLEEIIDAQGLDNTAKKEEYGRIWGKGHKKKDNYKLDLIDGKLREKSEETSLLNQWNKEDNPFNIA